MSCISKVREEIESRQPKGKTKLIANDGRGGSGKSSLAKDLANIRADFTVLSVDAFPCTPDKYPWHVLGTQTRIDWERLRDEALQPLVVGQEAKFRRTYWWPSQAPTEPEIITPGGTVIVEGTYSLLRQLRHLYDLRIWVECPAEEALENAVRRDGEACRIHWREAYTPNESSYIESHDPAEAADLLLLNSRVLRYQIIDKREFLRSRGVGG